MLDQLVLGPSLRPRYVGRLLELMRTHLSVEALAQEAKRSLDELRVYLDDDAVAAAMFDSSAAALVQSGRAAAQLVELFALRHRELESLVGSRHATVPPDDRPAAARRHNLYGAMTA